MAIDQESGDATFATVVVEVLSEGQSSKNTLVLPNTLLIADDPTNWNKFWVYVCVFVHCSPSQSTGRWPSDRLHCWQSLLSEHGVHDRTWMYPVSGDVAEEETQRAEGPAGERLRGPGQTPQCGEIIIYYNSSYLPWCVCQDVCVSEISSKYFHRAYDGSNWWVIYFLL